MAAWKLAIAFLAGNERVFSAWQMLREFSI
jgi:hypothetical protein